eukprot:TRINITY_DN4043_c0_g1_i1.p1 TRINITY_DN4043_c0_g1~~TRINITY_DN4043_c0_g1_i1.p1  ORF type:complete len:362 (+),score=64.66 TRINITY_DN4043_c0_g1_i1:48-1088(+)
MSVGNKLPLEYTAWDEAASRAEQHKGESVIVLLGTGSYNPVHTEHVQLMAKSIETLRSQRNEAVVCGLLSPSHQSYVYDKLRDSAIPKKVRYQILCDTINDLNQQHDILPCSWELEQESFSDHPDTIKSFKDYLEKKAGKKVQLWYVCGADLYKNCCSYSNKHGADGLVVVKRGLDSVSNKKLSTNVVVLEPVKPKSSTLIRKAGTDESKLSELMSPTAVATYLAYKKQLLKQEQQKAARSREPEKPPQANQDTPLPSEPEVPALVAEDSVPEGSTLVNENVPSFSKPEEPDTVAPDVCQLSKTMNSDRTQRYSCYKLAAVFLSAFCFRKQIRSWFRSFQSRSRSE